MRNSQLRLLRSRCRKCEPGLAKPGLFQPQHPPARSTPLAAPDLSWVLRHPILGATAHQRLGRQPDKSVLSRLPRGRPCGQFLASQDLTYCSSREVIVPELLHLFTHLPRGAPGNLALQTGVEDPPATLPSQTPVHTALTEKDARNEPIGYSESQNAIRASDLRRGVTAFTRTRKKAPSSTSG